MTEKDGFEKWWESFDCESIDEMQRKDIAYSAWNAALESKWEPIETAPRNGTIILASDGSNWVRVVIWAKELGLKCGDDHDLELHPWLCLDEDHGLNAWEDGSLTHWIPLPKPPSSEE